MTAGELSKWIGQTVEVPVDMGKGRIWCACVVKDARIVFDRVDLHIEPVNGSVEAVPAWVSADRVRAVAK